MTKCHLTDEEVSILDSIERGERHSKFDDVWEKNLVGDGLIEKRGDYYCLTELGQKVLDRYG